MSDPYEVLSLGRDADEEAIRRRYLELVRQNPPDRQPQRFAEIRAAYEQLRDPVVSMRTRLFDMGSSASFDELLKQTRPDFRERLTTEKLLELAHP